MAQRLAKIVLALFCASASANHIVRSDRHWNDTAGKRIEAHAAGMLQSPVDGRWYWYGESKKTAPGPGHGINCYSANTIAGPWTYEGSVFAQDRIKQPDCAGPFIVERPKVLYNTETKKFVMWFHLDANGYSYRHAGVAQSDSPTGPFEYVHGFRPDGLKSLDMSLFRDPVDGKAYFVRSVDNKYVGISRLTPDYLNSTGMISKAPLFEGMALFRHPNGTYYIMTSHLTGWNPNPLMLFRAEGATLDDPQWVNMGNPTGSSTSFNSQPTYVVQYTPTSGEPYFVYLADNWVHCKNEDGTTGPLINACYIWLPIQFNANSVDINWCQGWDLDDPFAPCPTPSPAPGPEPKKQCKLSAAPTAGDPISLAECEDGAASQQWSFTGNFEAFSWGSISDSKACEVNADGIRRTDGLGDGFTLESCQLACQSKPGCVAVDFYKSSGWCNLFSTACSHPMSTKDGASSYKITGQEPGKAGALRTGDNLCLYADSDAHLKSCSGGSDQAFLPDDRRLKKESDGKCLDVLWCGVSACDEKRLDSYACNSAHPNQQFAFDSGTGHLFSSASGKQLCVTVCNGISESKSLQAITV